MGLLSLLNACVMEIKKSQLLTLMLPVTNLANAKRCEKPGKLLKPWQMGTHLRVLGESFPMNTNMTGLRWFSEIFAFL